MTPIENTRQLRSAFLKIGWAPLVCIIGAVLIMVYTTVSIVNNYHHAGESMVASIKPVLMLTAVVSLAGYLLSYIGFAQAHKQFGLSKAGAAFSAMKIIFLIYCIIGVLMLILALVMPSSVESYANMGKNPAARMATFGGIIIFLAYIILEVFSIIALFIIKSSAAKIAATTNIASFKNVATGARWGVYCFFLSLIVALLSVAVNSEAIITVLSLLLLAAAIFALVKWIGGWLGAASEVIRHPVEAEDYNDTPQQ